METIFAYDQLPLHVERWNMRRKPKISSLPMSIREESVHLAASGSAAQEKAGPKQPNPGPTLPMAEITVLIASVKPTPNAISSVQPIQTTAI